MHTKRRFAKRFMAHRSISKIGHKDGQNDACAECGCSIGSRSGRVLGDVLSSNRKLLGGFDSHLDPSARAAQQGDQNRPVREQLREGHARVHAVRRLDNDRFVGTSAEYQHGYAFASARRARANVFPCAV